MRKLCFVLALGLMSSLVFANNSLEKDLNLEILKIVENNTIDSNTSTLEDDVAGPCFIIVQTLHSDGTKTLHGSIYTGEPGCSGTAVLTLVE